MKIFAIVIFLFTIHFVTYSQTWVNKDEQKSQKTFQQFKSSFEEAWKNKPYERGKGYKPFKRWEYKWEHRLNADGSFPAAGFALSEYNKFKKRNPSVSRAVGSWENLGPNSTTGGYAGTGRINSVAFDPVNSDIIYVGSAGGGLWKSVDGGSSWTAKTDLIGSLGVSAILVDPVNTSIIYIATGDGDAADNYSIGVLKSTDGGNTWNTTGLNWASSSGYLVRAMEMDPDDNTKIALASNGGIYRTTNSGTSWVLEQSGNFYDIKFKPLANANIAYACTNSIIYKSIDDGNTWASAHTITGSQRMTLAVSQDNAAYVYALSANNTDYGLKAVYASTNSGDSFSSKASSPNLLGWNADGSDSGGQGWYDLIITADPNNASTVHVGGVNHWKSTDGGSNWSIVSTWNGSGGVQTVHADKHVFGWQGTSLWEGNDGGIYESTNGGSSWTDRTGNLIISQMYRVGISELDNKVMAGLQDNGSKMRSNLNTWSDKIGGDGMDCAINPGNANILYGSLQQGSIKRSTNGGSSWANISSNITGGQPIGSWVTPYVLDPILPSTIIAGYTDLYKSIDQGDTWTTLGSSFGIGKMTFIDISSSNSSYIYAGNSSNLRRTIDGGANWQTMTVPGSSTSMVKVSPLDPNTIFAVRQGYSGGSKVFKSTNGGATWTNISGSLPNIPANCIAIHNDGEETLYLGMDVGVYYKNNSVADWTLINTALPNVVVSEIEIKESSNELYIATFGRGLWKNGTVGQTNYCETPTNLMASPSDFTEIGITWTAPSVIPTNGYEWAYNSINSIPTTTNFTIETSATAINLTSGTTYYFFVRALCSSNTASSWITLGPVHTTYGCNATVYDTGGSAGAYKNGEEYSYSICPNQSNGIATLTFTILDIEANWDAMYVHDGPTSNDPLFSSGNPASSAGFPAGGYWGTTIPGPFSSTHVSGCLTISFKSDTYETGAGWAADISCIYNCSTTVSNLNDSGLGSLRDAIDCSDGTENLIFDPTLIGQSIMLDNSISISKNVVILLSGNDYLNVHNTGLGSVFTCLAGNTIELQNIHIYSGLESDGAAISNSGNLTLNNVTVHKNINNPSPTSVIKNNGVLTIRGLTKIIGPN